MTQDAINYFPVGVAEKLKFYIYRLIDPRNGETFYVGKGKGDRLFQHVNAVRASDVTALDDENNDESQSKDDDSALKIKRINDIHRSGLGVIHVVHRHGIEDSKVAYEVEAALIDVFPGLGNIVGGHGSNDRGPMHAQQIIDKYALPELELGVDKLVMINVNSYEHNTNQELLDRVRYAWRINKHRAEHADYVLAVIHGIVRGVFVAEKWVPATPEYFPSPFPEAISPRLGFIGHVAPADVWEKYVGERGKRLPEDNRNKSQNPVKYYNC